MSKLLFYMQYNENACWSLVKFICSFAWFIKKSVKRKEGRKDEGISFKAKGGGLLFDVLSVRVGSVR